jgi:hypothetical protein
MDEQSLAKLLLAISGDDADHWERTEGKTSPGPACPPLPRLRNAVLREDWTDAELRHKAGCDHCRHTEGLVLSRVWHPSPAQLYHQPQPGGKDPDSAQHLSRDRCRRCDRLGSILHADPLLRRLAGRGKPDRAALERVLGSGRAAREPISSRRLTFDDRGLSVAVTGYTRPEFYLERAGVKSDARLLYALLGSERHVMLPHPVAGSRLQAVKLRLEALPPERAPLVLFGVEPELLSAEEAPLLTDAVRQCEADDPAGLPAWRDWAAGALGCKDLDPSVRDLLVKVQRDGGGRHPR